MECGQYSGAVYGMRGRKEEMIVPITVDDQDIIVLQRKINRERGNVTVADVRKAISDALEKYAEYELMEEVYEDLV
jgi:hypothetical protein